VKIEGRREGSFFSRLDFVELFSVACLITPRGSATKIVPHFEGSRVKKA